MLQYKNNLDFARHLDTEDALAPFRNKFHIPKDNNGNQLIYFCGNSLGLQPRDTKTIVGQELVKWAALGVEGWFQGKDPWLKYTSELADKMAPIVGAKPIEIAIMNTLTANLHFMMVSFYRPTKKRFKIVLESDGFPSDKYAVASQLRNHGFDLEEGLIYWKPPKGQQTLRYDDLEAIIEKQGDEIALLLLSGVNYYTGQYLDLKRITEMGHNYGCKVGFDCAHAAGNVALNLHDSGADFAVWCTYKYLNSGPGSISGCFVHERYAHSKELNRFAGWWGQNEQTRFNMRMEYDPIPGAEGWQISTPPILSMAPIKASLQLFDEVGMEKLIKKSRKLIGYFEFLLHEFGEDKISIITPSSAEERGCQLSLQVKNANRSVFEKLMAAGVICDWREPDVIRCAPVPLYNTFEEVFEAVQRLKKILS